MIGTSFVVYDELVILEHGHLPLGAGRDFAEVGEALLADHSGFLLVPAPYCWAGAGEGSSQISAFPAGLGAVHLGILRDRITLVWSIHC